MKRITGKVLLASATIASASGVLIAGAPGASAASATDYGPNTCLQGYVWRAATPGDVVCVTPATRAQAQYDNNQASARRSPTGGAYGPNTCLQGFVWREAVAGDEVCVTPATRAQAQYDNGQAANRRASVDIWITNWYPSPTCSGGTCTSTSDDDIPHIKVNGDHFNVNGKVWIGFYRLNGQLIKSYTLTATPHNGYAGGSFGKQTTAINCSPKGTAKPDSYVRSYDYTSGRWSNSVSLTTQCATL